MAFKKEELNKVKEFVAGLGEAEKTEFMNRYSALENDEQRAKVISNVLSRVSSSNDSTISNTSNKEELGSVLKKRMSEVDVDVAKRGDYLEGMAQNLTSQSPLRKGLGFVQGIALPSTALEAGISNPALAMQRGVFNPGRLLEESYKGFTLEKTGQYGDVFRGAIPDKTTGKAVGAIGGLTLSVAGPVKTFQVLKSTFGDVSKITDKTLKTVGTQLVGATDEAEKFVGESIGNAYAKLNAIPVDGNSWTRVIKAIPNTVRDEVTRTMGDPDTLLPTVENLRKIKSLLGKYRPSSFGKEARGVSENIEAARLDEVYSGAKSVLTNTLSKAIGTKNTAKLLDLDDSATKVYGAINEVRSAITNPRMLSPTKVGKVAKGIEDTGDLSTREAINILRRGGGRKAKKLLDKAVRSLEIFNSRERAWKVAGHIVSAATYGGAIGAVGGAAAGRFLGRGGGE